MRLRRPLTKPEPALDTAKPLVPLAVCLHWLETRSASRLGSVLARLRRQETLRTTFWVPRRRSAALAVVISGRFRWRSGGSARHRRVIASATRYLRVLAAPALGPGTVRGSSPKGARNLRGNVDPAHCWSPNAWMAGGLNADRVAIIAVAIVRPAVSNVISASRPQGIAMTGNP